MIPVDLCIALSGPLLDVWLPLYTHTLLRTTDLHNVNMHWVDKGITPRIADWVQDFCDNHGGDLVQMPSPVFNRGHFPDIGAARREELRIVHDYAETMQFFVDNCGTEDAVFASHFDIEFKRDWLSYLRCQLRQDVGQVGQHTLGLVGWSRTALASCDVGFHSVSGCYLVKNHYGRWKPWHGADPRCVDKSIPIEAWSEGDLVEMSLSHWGWKVLIDTDAESNLWRVHSGNGSGRNNDSVLNAMIRERTLNDLHRLGLEPIE